MKKKILFTMMLFLGLVAVLLIVGFASHPVSADELESPAQSFAASSVAGGGPVGNVFTVTTENLREVNPAVAYNPDREEYLVVWYNDRSGNDDIRAQRISKNGELVGGAFYVAGGSVERRHPDVAYNRQNQEYLVIWEEHTTAVNIVGQRVPETGGTQGGEIDITNHAGPAEARTPKVAYASTDGKWLVVWSFSPWGNDWSIRGVNVEDDGSVANDFSVSHDPGGQAREVPDLAYNRARNEFLVAWQQWAGSDYNIHARRVTGGGNPLQPTSIEISPIMGYDYKHPAVVAIPTIGSEGQYLVVYEDHSVGKNISARLVDGSGTPDFSGSFTVNSLYTAGDDSTAPDVAGADSAGHYLVVWEQEYSSGMLLFDGVYAREVSAGGDPAGDRETDAGGIYAEYPVVTDGPLGDFLIVFDDPTLIGDHNIYGRLWGNRLYLPLVMRNR
jgi:hypothetical protein